jgi:hypothetical protein
MWLSFDSHKKSKVVSFFMEIFLRLIIRTINGDVTCVSCNSLIEENMFVAPDLRQGLFWVVFIVQGLDQPYELS